MSIPVISDLWDIGKTISTELGKWIKDLIKFIFTNFRYDTPFHLFTLSMIFLLLIVAFLGLFGAAGMGAKYAGISVGSGSVMSGTGKVGTLFSDSEGVGGEALNDIDADGIPDDNDGDIDGDGIPNSEDLDVDGDGVPNEDDPTPCGAAITTCNIPFPSLCGNDICDNFKTDSTQVYLDFYYSFCSDKNLYHNIPEYCFVDEFSGETITVTNSTWGDITYYDAVCGNANLQAQLNQRCFLFNSSIYYSETEENCPADCNSTEYECFADYTCDLNDNCGPNALNCCPPGTLWAGHCTDCDLSWGYCNDVSGNCILGAGTPLPQLKNIPYHCDCSTDPDCISDWGGATCCGAGTYHIGFCYTASLCNVTG